MDEPAVEPPEDAQQKEHKPRYLVIGLYTDTNQRWSDSFDLKALQREGEEDTAFPFQAEEFERAAQELIESYGHDDLVIAGIVDTHTGELVG